MCPSQASRESTHDDEVKELLQDTVRSLRNSMRNYWPSDEGGRNDPSEKNFCIHLAHILLGRGFSVFAEAWGVRLGSKVDRQTAVDVHEESDVSRSGHVDLLGIHPSTEWFLAVEAKRLLSNKPGEGLDAMKGDLCRLNGFRLTEPQGDWVGAHRRNVLNRCQRGWGLVGGLLWVEEPASWDLLQAWNGGEVLQRNRPECFFRKLSDLKGRTLLPIKMQPPRVEPDKAESEAKKSAYHLLAAIFPIPH